MKTLLAFVAIGVWAFVGYSFWQKHSTITSPPASNRVYAAPALEPAIPRSQEIIRFTGRDGNTPLYRVQLGSNEIRKFEIDLDHVSRGTARASGCFYDVDPTVTTQPERMNPDAKQWTQAGDIVVHGLPANLIDGTHWTGWLQREGVADNGWGKTVASYRVATEPEPKAAPSATWAETRGHTALDQRPQR